MERSSSGASGDVAEVRLSVPERLVDRLVAAALVQGLTPGTDPGEAADLLAELADGRLRALDRARSQILRNEDGRPTKVTSSAAAALQLAHTVASARLGDAGDG
jgi:hypothetical protein